jgi:hypothetical protein
VFVVDDILLSCIVLPYSKRLLGKGQDQLFDWLDNVLGEAGKKLNKIMSSRNNEVDVLKDLGQYVIEHPKTADTLARAASAAELNTAFGLLGARGDEEVLKAVRDYFLTPVIEMVKVLERPVILHGFLTGTDQLTAIDVRTIPRGEQLENMDIRQRENFLTREPYPTEIVLWRRGRQTFAEQNHWLPRIWLVRAMDEELVGKLRTTPGELAAKLDKLARDDDTTPQRFCDLLENQPFVTAITRRRVVVDRAQMMFGVSPPSTRERTERIPWAEDPAGIHTMRAELEGQLEGQQDEQERWLQALTNWAA